MQENMSTKNKAEKKCEGEEDWRLVHKFSEGEESIKSGFHQNGVNEEPSVAEPWSERASEKAKKEGGDTSDWNDEATQACAHSLTSSLLNYERSGAMVKKCGDEGLCTDGDAKDTTSFYTHL